MGPLTVLLGAGAAGLSLGLTLSGLAALDGSVGRWRTARRARGAARKAMAEGTVFARAYCNGIIHGVRTAFGPLTPSSVDRFRAALAEAGLREGNPLTWQSDEGITVRVPVRNVQVAWDERSESMMVGFFVAPLGLDGRPN